MLGYLLLFSMRHEKERRRLTPVPVACEKVPMPFLPFLQLYVIHIHKVYLLFSPQRSAAVNRVAICKIIASKNTKLPIKTNYGVGCSK